MGFNGVDDSDSIDFLRPPRPFFVGNIHFVVSELGEPYFGIRIRHGSIPFRAIDVLNGLFCAVAQFILKFQQFANNASIFFHFAKNQKFVIKK
jgi:hypothetical protein